MRKVLAIIAVILYEISLSSGLVSDNKQISNLGTPSEKSYGIKQVTSKVPWDMIIENGKLYIGGGDYNDNTGPVDIHCMDLETKEWTVSGTLNDEAIGKFIRIEDQIYAPGFDAKSSKTSGNFYWLENGTWCENNTLPGAAHNYDITKYDEKFLFAIGTWNATYSPVWASEDNGNTFYGIPFYKNGSNIIEENEFDYMRVYDFFHTENGLYCIFIAVTKGKAQYYEFYRYEDEAFHFVSTTNDNGLKIKSLKQEPIASELTFRGYNYIAAYHLSRTKDFQTVETIVLPRREIAVDLLTDDEKLYVLCAEPIGDTCIVRIYAYVYNSFFYPVLSYESLTLPMSFAKNGKDFYIGFGKQGSDDSNVGSIITVSVSELELKLIQDCL